MIKCVRELVAMLIAGIACSGAGAASPQVLPPANTGIEGVSANVIALGGGSGGRYQVVYAASQMTGIPGGSWITGIRLRQNNSATAGWPATARTISDYEIHLGEAARDPDNLSLTFVENRSTSSRVRNGALSLAAGAYPGSAAGGSLPEAWGPLIAFSTEYLYLGGALAIEFQSTGSAESGSADSENDGSEFGGLASLTRTSATGTRSAALIVQLTFRAPTAPFQTGVTRLMIPDDLANSRGGDVNNAAFRDGPQTNQVISDESEMRRLGRGSNLIGLLPRSGMTGAWPLVPEFFTRYDIQVARAPNTPTAMSTSIVDNMGPDITTVRSGELSVTTGAIFPMQSAPRPAIWRYTIPFTTAYTYLGGPLATLVRHEGATESGSGLMDGTSLFPSRVRMRTTSGNSNATVTFSNFGAPVNMWSVDSGTVVPNANATVRGPASALDGLFASFEATSQLMLSGSELTHIPVGSQITGISFRTRTGSPRPGLNVTFTDYLVFMSTATNRPADASATFAQNEGADKVQVRSGPLHLPAGSFPGLPIPNAFGPTIHFDRAFVYQGGDLCITIRHGGGLYGGWPIDVTSNMSLSKYLVQIGIDATDGEINNLYGAITRLAYNPSVVAPAAVDNTPGNAGYALMFSNAGTVMQAVYAPDELTGLRIGSLITGMSLRRYSRTSNTPEWPTSDANITRFDVTMSTSPVLPGAMSDTFANNIGADAVVVRSGSITIPANAFPHVLSQTRPNESRWFIQFDEPFVYKGGPLSLTIRNDSGAGGTTFFADAVTGNAGAAGRWATGVNASTHSQGANKGALAARFVFVPRSFCPADLNNDGVVEDSDFVHFLGAYNTLECTDGAMPQGCPADLNYDRAVNDGDFEVFLGAYDALVCP